MPPVTARPGVGISALRAAMTTLGIAAPAAAAPVTFTGADPADVHRILVHR